MSAGRLCGYTSDDGDVRSSLMALCDLSNRSSTFAFRELCGSSSAGGEMRCKREICFLFSGRGGGVGKILVEQV